jgi:hypothetical protein
MVFGNEKRQDFRLCNESKAHVKPESETGTDMGYQGIAKKSLPIQRRSERKQRKTRQLNKVKRSTAPFQAGA